MRKEAGEEHEVFYAEKAQKRHTDQRRREQEDHLRRMQVCFYLKKYYL